MYVRVAVCLYVYSGAGRAVVVELVVLVIMVGVFVCVARVVK